MRKLFFLAALLFMLVSTSACDVLGEDYSGIFVNLADTSETVAIEKDKLFAFKVLINGKTLTQCEGTVEGQLMHLTLQGKDTTTLLFMSRSEFITIPSKKPGAPEVLRSGATFKRIR